MKIMKKQSIYALMSAIALTGAVGFSSCSSSSNDEVINNPDFYPETNSVKTQFAISLQDNVLNNKTRMAADNVQKDGYIKQFKGISGMKLLPFDGNTLNGAVVSLTPDIDATASGSTDGTTEKVKVYSNVQLQTGTDRILFYGHAQVGTEGFSDGALIMPTSYASTAGINFSPKPINDSKETITGNAGYAVCTNLLTLMTSVANSKTASPVTTWGPAGDGETRIADPAMQTMYNNFVSMQAGSSQMVKDALEDLYNELATIIAANDGRKALAEAIQTSILASNANSVSEGKLTLDSKYSGYPGNFNLPDGAAYIKWDATNKRFNDNAIDGSGTITPLAHYAYPANIQYFVDSPIKTQTSKVLDESKTWNDNLALYTGTNAGTKVEASTRSVALVNQVKYGVARFDVSVAQLNNNSYYDRNGVVVNVTNGFTLKGIIVGGQKPVDYKFEQTTGISYSMYDNVMPSNKTITPTIGTGTNYTLVLQNKENDTEGINFALELINNGADFEGKDGIVPAGGTFYLVGNLLPASATNYATADSGIKDYVFKQDYYTSATCTIGNGSLEGSGGLAEATNCLPDLTAPAMELGFSVDLTWKAGLLFDVVF